MRFVIAVFSLLLLSAQGHAQPSVDVGSASGAPGERVSFDVTLSGVDQAIVGVQNDTAFDSINTPIAATPGGTPDCWVNPEIEDEVVFGFGFFPIGCVGAACTSMRGIVNLFLFNQDGWTTFPDGALLYSCNVDISPAAAAGSYPLVVSNTLASDPNGFAIAAVGSDGEIRVLDEPTSKDDCKNGGWRDFTSPREFKNQGDCIQYVNTGK